MAAEGSQHDKIAKATDATASTMRPQWFPVNAHEAPEALVVVAPLPAVMPNDVTIELGPSTLRISSRLRSSGPREYVLHEWEYGGYEREIDLPDGFRGGLEATLTNGQLVVRVLRGPFSRRVSVQPHDLPGGQVEPGGS
jgi:HSP20 family molecular chaperone IbpA